MNGLRMLRRCVTDTPAMMGITCPCPDKLFLFFRCPKQSGRGFIKENDFTAALGSSVPVSFPEHQSVPCVFPRAKSVGPTPVVFPELAQHQRYPGNTFFVTLKPSSQQLNLSPWSSPRSDKWLIQAQQPKALFFFCAKQRWRHVFPLQVPMLNAERTTISSAPSPKWQRVLALWIKSWNVKNKVGMSRKKGNTISRIRCK